MSVMWCQSPPRGALEQGWTPGRVDVARHPGPAGGALPPLFWSRKLYLNPSAPCPSRLPVCFWRLQSRPPAPAAVGRTPPFAPSSVLAGFSA